MASGFGKEKCAGNTGKRMRQTLDHMSFLSNLQDT